MDDPEPAPAAADPREFRLRPWLVLPLGLGVGLLSGTYSYLLQRWMDNGAVRAPVGEYFWVVSFNLIVWVWWFGLIAIVLWLGRHLRITRENAWHLLPAHAVIGVLFALVNGIVVGSLRQWVFWVSGFLAMPAGARLTLLSAIQRELLTTFENQVLIYGGVIAVSHLIHFNRAFQARELQHSRLQARLVEAQLAALQRQLQPHFLFNTLHAIASLVHRDPDSAEAMIVRLGDLLRAVFRSDVRQEVPLAHEIQLLEQYLDIQRVRFGGGLITEIDVAEEVAGVAVPVLLLQPLVENAVKHGFLGGSREGVIRLEAARVAGRVRIVVRDNGRGLGGRALGDVIEGVGLKNTRARLEHLYPGAHTLTFDAPPGGGFLVTITLPFQVTEEAGAMPNGAQDAAHGPRYVSAS